LKKITGVLQAEVEKKRLTQEKCDTALTILGTVATLEDLADCDLVIEAATEHHETKVAVFSEARSDLSSGCSPRDEHLVAERHGPCGLN